MGSEMCIRDRNHEYFESKFESFYKTDYRTAHNKTEESGRIWDPYKENN